MTRELDFYRKCLEQLGLETRLESEDGEYCNYDYGFRKMTGREISMTAFMDLYSPRRETPAIVKVFDSYVLSYIIVEIPEDRLLVGPYYSLLPTTETIREVAFRHDVSSDGFEDFWKLYYRIPELKDERALTSSTSVLMKLYWNDNWEMREHNATLYDIVTLHSGEAQDSETIEERYRNENLMMDSVMRGDDTFLKGFEEKVKRMDIAMRIPDPVRNLKNYAIILNTILRKAAEKGGVSLIDLDRFSDKFARSIESCITIEKLLSVITSMPYGYITLVKEKKELGYSSLVTKAIRLMEEDMTLTLVDVATRLNVTPGWLSKCISRDTGMGFSALMMRLRVGFAGYLLIAGKMTVEEIAYRSGFTDISYFSSVFRKIKGMTPTEWRKRGFQKEDGKDS